jgi:iron(III) transport system ATP-binding protein
MNKGKIEQIGSPTDIYRWPASRFVADFIGRANFVQASVDPKSNGQAVVQVLGRTCQTSLRFDYHAGMKTIAMLRPEALRLREDSSLQQVTIEQAMYLGSEVEYIVHLGQNRLVVVEQDPRFQQIYQEGQTVGIDFIDEAVHMLPDD